MQEALCGFEVSKLLKELGFVEHCRYGWEYYEHAGQVFGPVELDENPLEYRFYAPVERRLMDDERARFLQSRYVQVLAYHNGIFSWWYARPTQSLIMRWLREVHGINVNPYPDYDDTQKSCWEINVCSLIERLKEGLTLIFHSGGNPNEIKRTYEEAAELGIIKALQSLIKSQKS